MKNPQIKNSKIAALVTVNKEAQEVVGHAVSEFIRNHLTRLNKERHRGLYMGGFYAQAADSVSYKVEKAGKSVEINFTANKIGLMQRIHGGTIKPKNAKLLTIPNWKEIAATATHRATEFQNLFFVKFKSGAMALADKGEGTYKGKKVKGGSQKPLRIFYWLVKSVHQKPDPSVLPDDKQILKVAERSVTEFAKSLGVTT